MEKIASTSVVKKSFIGKMVAFVRNHKIWIGILIIAAIFILYWGYGKLTSTAGETDYVLSAVTKGTVVASVSGTGQVSAANTIDIKPKASGELVWIGVKAGQTVYAGQALMSIDDTDAKKAIADAEHTLITSRLQFQKDSAQAPIDYQKTLDSLSSANTDLQTAYNDTFNTLSSTYLDLPTIMSGLQNILFGSDMNPTGGQWNIDILSNMFSDDSVATAKINTFAQNAKDDYASTRTKYDASVLAYKQTTRSSSGSDIDKLLMQSIDVAAAAAQALQDELNLFGTVNDTAQVYNRRLPSAFTTLQTNARTYLSTINTDLSNLLSQKKNLDSGKQAITAAKQNITLLQVGNPTEDNPISLQISKNNLAGQESNLTQLKTDLANYTITAPFDGVIAKVNVKVGDTISNGTAVATILSKQEQATITLNEVDAAKIKLGQKATVTFDAIDGLNIAGEVIDIDTLGTVSQGVVTYNYIVNFDTQDDRVKAGMTVSVAVITDVKQDVLTVPNAAVKTQNGGYYVQILPGVSLAAAQMGSAISSSVPPTRQSVQTGLSNDTITEITNGLKEGDLVVTRTVTATAGMGASSAPSLLNAVSGTRAGGTGGAARVFRGN